MRAGRGGWKRPEVIGAVEQTLEENKAKFDHLVDTEKTAKAINDCFIKTMTSAARPFLAKDTKRRTGLGDQKPCTSDETVNAKERGKRRCEQKKKCDHEGGEPRAKAQDERQIDRTHQASLDQSMRDKKEA